MSKPRYHWWGYVKWVIKDYKAKNEELNDMRAQSTTASYNGMPSGTDPQRGAENVALKCFSGQKQREYEAVEKAVATISTYYDGKERLALIDRVFWAQTHTLQGAALAGHISQRTAERWHAGFIRMVAQNMGYLD